VYPLLAMMEQCLKEISQLTPNLYLASVAAISDEALNKNNINLIINASKELSMFPPKDNRINTIRVPVYDNCEETLYPYFKPICELMQANEEKGGSTLVHCVAGRSRSSTLCIAYLLWKDGCQGPKHKLYEILEFVQKKRSIVQPNMAFMGQLVQWEDQLKGNIKPSKQLSDKENNAIKDIVHLTQQIKS